MTPVPKHFLQLRDFSRDELEHLFARTRWIKERFKRYEIYQPLRDRTLAMVFDKASTRTRVSFEAGMNQLGGIAINLARGDTQLSRGEPIEDVARVVSRMVDVVMIRTFEQGMIERFAAHSRVPVINGLTNEYHPCQILADVFTYVEHRGAIQGRTVAWIGDSNNVLYTWIQAAALLDFTVHVASPKGYGLDAARVAPDEARHVRAFDDPLQACHNADLVTTDVWTSMGFESENDARLAAFADWMVDREMMGVARPDALFMHCLPAHRGEEVAADVIDGPQSVVWDEAENRLHTQKALLEYLVCGRVDAATANAAGGST
jgi:ornithine carbamoyltransferase